MVGGSHKNKHTMDYYYEPSNVEGEPYGSLADYANGQRIKMEKQARLAKMTIDLKTALGMMDAHKQAILEKMTIDLNMIVKQWNLDNKVDRIYADKHDTKITY